MIYNQKPPSKHTLKEENDPPFRIEDKHFEFQYLNTPIITRAYLKKQKQKQTSNIHSTSIVTIIFWGEQLKKKEFLPKKLGASVGWGATESFTESTGVTLFVKSSGVMLPPELMGSVLSVESDMTVLCRGCSN